LDEPRLDNDANHERGWGAGVGPGASGEGVGASWSEAGRTSVTLEGEGGCTRSVCGSSG
jgi:hypothetical protein